MLISMNRKEKKYVRNYSKVELPSYLKVGEFKEYINSQLPFHNWNKAGHKFHWNNYVFFVKVGYDVQISYDSEKAFIFLDDKRIPIKLQDYFHLLFVNKMKKYKITKKWFEDDYLLKSIITIEDRIKTDLNKIYRTDMMIKVDETKYVCIEFFEKHHYDIDDLDFVKERNRMLNILYNNNNQDRQIVHFSVFWSQYLTDEKYIDAFIKNIIKVINEYTDVSYERKWCIDAMNKYINDRQLTEIFYDSFKDKNKPLIEFDDFTNLLITWKDNDAKNKYIKEFKKYIESLNKDYEGKTVNDDLDFLESDSTEGKLELSDTDKVITPIYYESNKLTYNGLFEFISNLSVKYLVDHRCKSKLNQLFKNITTGFIEGIQERQKQLNSLNDNKIYGLEHYKS